MGGEVVVCAVEEGVTDCGDSVEDGAVREEGLLCRGDVGSSEITK